jgi:hypothetical protein
MLNSLPCNICYETIGSLPFVFKCGHSLCIVCTKLYLENISQNSNCPFCRKKVTSISPNYSLRCIMEQDVNHTSNINQNINKIVNMLIETTFSEHNGENSDEDDYDNKHYHHYHTMISVDQNISSCCKELCMSINPTVGIALFGVSTSIVLTVAGIFAYQ